MHCPQCIVIYVCMKQIEREGKKLPQGGGSGGGLIGPRKAVQSFLRGVRRNPPETSMIQPTRKMYAWMIFINNFTPSNFQIFKIISESNLSKPLSQNEMIGLDSGSIGTNTDSEKRLKSSKGSGVEIGSESGSKSRSWKSVSYTHLTLPTKRIV